MKEDEEKLIAVIAERFRKLKKDGFALMDSEEAVKHGAILPVLQDLGWSVFDPNECRPEYGPSWKVDYALSLKGKPRIFIEAKAISSPLSPDNQLQLCNYTSQHGVPLAILTNGKSWEFYLALTEGLFYERKVYSIELDHQDIDEAAGRIVKLLSRSRVESGEAEAYAKRLHESHLRDAAIDAALPKAWERLFRDPDSILVDYLAEEAEAICGFKPDPERVRTFLRRAEKSTSSAPVIQKARRSMPKRKRRAQTKPVTATGKKPSRVSVLGMTADVETWRDVLITICGVMAELHPKGHAEVLLGLSGRSMVYFSRDKRRLRAPLRIPNSTLYAEGNLSADQIMRNCKKILVTFGHKTTDFSVDIA